MPLIGLSVVAVTLACLWFLLSARSPARQFKRPIWALVLFLPVAIGAGLVFSLAILTGFGSTGLITSPGVLPFSVVLFFLLYALVFGSVDIVYRAFVGRWMPAAVALFLALSIVFARFIVPIVLQAVGSSVDMSGKGNFAVPIDLMVASGSFAIVTTLIYMLRAVTRPSERAAAV